MDVVDRFAVTPVSQPVSGSIRPPGSKSLTNRALIIAALAEGDSRLSNVLDSVDTQVMRESLDRLGVRVEHNVAACEAVIAGCVGRPPVDAAELWLENSGTSIRFLTALCCLGEGTYRLDGNSRMRERPIGDLVAAMNSVGCDVECARGNDCPPVVINARGIRGGHVEIAGHLSSQFLSALLMAAPCAASPIEIRVVGELVSKPYVEMTLGVMASFGTVVEATDDSHFVVPNNGYLGHNYSIEPDASAASYFFGMAAVTGGEVTVEGLSAYSLQGDVAFVEALEQMGCRVDSQSDHITVHGENLRGIDIDMNAISDTAQTLAAVAVFADGPTRIRNVAHMRHKETDRIAAMVNELQRAGISVEEHKDGLTVHPGEPRPALLQTYDDHRMAMSLALLGLKAKGIEIADPGCTAKTYPQFWDDFTRMCS